ncbi:MAG: hypothetical protein WAW37_08435 [Syntrophobacteraceae bacterium]
MTVIELPFRFKGNRDYIHGPDIYNDVVREIRSLHTIDSIELIRIKMKRMGRKQCQLIVGDIGGKLKIPSDALAEIFVRTPSGDLSAYLLETDARITRRQDYDEDGMQALCRMEGNTVSIDGSPAYSPVEVAVAMTKMLHQRLFPDPKGKWIVTQFELSGIFDAEDSSRLVVQLLHNFHNALTKSALRVGGAERGHIYFSLV